MSQPRPAETGRLVEDGPLRRQKVEHLEARTAVPPAPSARSQLAGTAEGLGVVGQPAEASPGRRAPDDSPLRRRRRRGGRRLRRGDARRAAPPRRSAAPWRVLGRPPRRSPALASPRPRNRRSRRLAGDEPTSPPVTRLPPDAGRLGPDAESVGRRAHTGWLGCGPCLTPSMTWSRAAAMRPSC
jgi:hypothetical protein